MACAEPASSAACAPSAVKLSKSQSPMRRKIAASGLFMGDTLQQPLSPPLAYRPLRIGLPAEGLGRPAPVSRGGRPVCCVRMRPLTGFTGVSCRPSSSSCAARSGSCRRSAAARSGSDAACRCRSGRRGPWPSRPRAAAASCWHRGSAGRPCAGGGACSPRTMSTVSLSRVILRSGFLPRVVHRRGRGHRATGRRSAPGRRGSRCFLSQIARFIMSSSLVPGCAAMKYGIRYCFLPASALNFSNICLNLS